LPRQRLSTTITASRRREQEFCVHTQPTTVWRTPGPLRTAAVLTAALLLVLAACDAGGARSAASGAAHPSAAAAPTSGPPPAPGLAGVATAAAAGITGELLQFTRDVAGRRVEVRLTAANDGLLIEALDLRTPGLPTSPAEPRGAQLHRGLPLDLPVILGPADCSGAVGAPAAEVRLGDAAGGSRTVTVPLEDDGLARRLHDVDCAEQALHSQADIEVTDVREVSTPDGPALRVAVRLSRAGGSEPVRVTGVGSNTIYSITAVGPLPTLRREPVVLDLSLLPARCDPHALGESYRTSLLGLVLALGDAPPRPFVITPAEDVRRRLEAFAVDTCRSRED
jgi:hypothetical protein